jgi:hypothetical protein
MGEQTPCSKVSCNNVINLVDGEQTPCNRVIGKRSANEMGSDKVDKAEAGEKSTTKTLKLKAAKIEHT